MKFFREIGNAILCLALPAYGELPMVYVSIGSRLDVIDLNSKETVASVALTTGVRPGAVFANADGRHIYVEDGRRIAVIDALDYSVSYLDPDPSQPGVSIAGISPNGARLYVNISRRLIAIDTGSGKALSTAYGVAGNILSFSPDGSRFYIPDEVNVAAVDSVSGKTLAYSGTYGEAAAMSPDGKSLYLVHNNDDQGCDSRLSILDTSTNKVVREDSVGKDICPKNIFLSPDGARAYLLDALPYGAPSSALKGLKIRTLDLSTRQWVGTIPADLYLGLAISQDGKSFIGVENNLPGGAGTIHVLDTAQNREIDSISTTEWINAFALAPQRPEVGEAPIRDAAAFLPRILRGGIASLFGSVLATGIEAAGLVPLPKSLLDTEVLLNGIAAPLYFTSPGQINFQVPWEVAAGPVSVQVRRNGIVSESRTVIVDDTGPGIFANSGGQGAVIHGDTGRLVAAANPAHPGEVLSVFATGLGPVKKAVASGEAPATVDETVNPVLVTVDGVSVEVLYSGLSGEYPGLYQVNFRFGAETRGGAEVALELTVSGKRSNKVLISLAR